ncbi:MAG: UvrD-helicase domain-containing protein [Gemmataceae bacterium]|nr:UvrD-helicase domain-containing protein [Gemmataceae bacterium]
MPPGSGADSDLLDDLTPPQREAVTHFEGPLLVLAGAGSGKTRVITRRVAWLQRQGVRPWNILAITFTNKAAGEMRRRIEDLVPNSRVWVSTFHSLGARLLRQYGDRIGLSKNFSIYDQEDRVKAVKDALEAAGVDNSKFTPERISGAISGAKNQLLNPEQYAAKASDYFALTAAKAYFAYEKKLKASEAVDFDDLLMKPALALRHDPELRAELDSRFRFVLIDEYQDTNAAQYEIARRISTDQPNICVVGDPDQSIYKWRGSDIKIILDFERDFAGAKTVALSENYRSTPAILAAASNLIAFNKQRKPKELTATKPAAAPVRVLTFPDGLAEADQIAARIRDARMRQGRAYRDVAIFLRINALSRALEAAFLKAGIPYQIVRGLAFYERKENKDLLAYLRLLVNPKDDFSFLRAVNEPARGIGATTIKHLRDYAAPREMSLSEACAQADFVPGLKPKAIKSLMEFSKLIEEMREHALEDAPDRVIERVLDKSGLRVALAAEERSDELDRLANVEEFLSAAKQFAAEDPTRTLTDFLEQVALTGDVDGWNEASDCVSVMTLHAAKGLEFPVVYMVAVEQGLLPHERSFQNEADIEEERRLCFVGMTRAKDELHLCHARVRQFRGQELYAVPSMFLEEIGDDCIEKIDMSHGAVSGPGQWSAPRRSPAADEGLPVMKSADGLDVGVLVDHAMYGRGKILATSGAGALRRLRIRFEHHGEKVFVASKVKLTVIVDD